MHSHRHDSLEKAPCENTLYLLFLSYRVSHVPCVCKQAPRHMCCSAHLSPSRLGGRGDDVSLYPQGYGSKPCSAFMPETTTINLGAWLHHSVMCCWQTLASFTMPAWWAAGFRKTFAPWTKRPLEKGVRPGLLLQILCFHVTSVFPPLLELILQGSSLSLCQVCPRSEAAEAAGFPLKLPPDCALQNGAAALRGVYWPRALPPLGCVWGRWELTPPLPSSADCPPAGHEGRHGSTYGAV